MNVKTITENFAVSEQILPEHMAALAEAGFKSIICNRPDGEAADQPNVIEIEAAAQAAGMACVYMPVTSGKVSDDDVVDFTLELDELPAPVVANNLLEDMGAVKGIAHYNGYGSCPLTVERGKIVLAEFGYGGKLCPSFPKWVINGTRPSRLAWLLKEKILPPVYWSAMLKGREWLARPEKPAANG